MEYFRNFPRVDYKFGDEFEKSGGGDTIFEITHDLGAYVDIIDNVRQNASFYSKYYIVENDRPDIVSQKIYGTPAYHWTFFMMNDNIRQFGWPLSINELDDKVKRDFPHQYIETRSDLTGIFLVGERAVGAQSSGNGIILKRNLDIGTIVVDSPQPFQQGEQASVATYSGITQAISVNATGFEYNMPRYYKNSSNEQVDIDPAVGPGALLTEVTQYDHYIEENDKLKTISVIRPDAINDVVGSYFQTMRAV